MENYETIQISFKCYLNTYFKSKTCFFIKNTLS